MRFRHLEKIGMLGRALNLATVTLLIGCFTAIPVRAQNLEAGKSPSQIFAGTCAACHKSPRGLLKTRAGRIPAGLSAPALYHLQRDGLAAQRLPDFQWRGRYALCRHQADAAAQGCQAATPEQLDRQGRPIRPAPRRRLARPSDAQQRPRNPMPMELCRKPSPAHVRAATPSGRRGRRRKCPKPPSPQGRVRFRPGRRRGRTGWPQIGRQAEAEQARKAGRRGILQGWRGDRRCRARKGRDGKRRRGQERSAEGRYAEERYVRRAKPPRTTPANPKAPSRRRRASPSRAKVRGRQVEPPSPRPPIPSQPRLMPRRKPAARRRPCAPIRFRRSRPRRRLLRDAHSGRQRRVGACRFAVSVLHRSAVAASVPPPPPVAPAGPPAPPISQ